MQPVSGVGRFFFASPLARPEGLWRSATALKAGKEAIGIFIPSWFSDPLDQQNSAREDLELSFDIKGCADRIAELELLFLENRTIQVWHMIDQHTFVVAAEHALLDEEAGTVITMSTYFARVPGCGKFKPKLVQITFSSYAHANASTQPQNSL